MCAWRLSIAIMLAVVLGVVTALPAGAQQQAPPAPAAAGEGAELAKKLANPVSDLVSVPFQFNWEAGVGPSEQTRFVLNVQPVMPFSISKDWNLIARIIMPFVSQPALVEGGAPTFGVSDIVTSFFLSPRGGGIIWGVGPVFSLPSTNEPTLGSGKWSAGPTFVLLKQKGRWTAGVLMNQVWSFSGDPARKDVSQMFLQPFLSYTTTSLVTFSVNSESTANWKADSEQWTVPINLTVSRLSSFGMFPANYQVGFGFFPVHPAIGPSWKIRGAIVLLLPKRR